MPDLAELQAQYRDRGVTCISFTARDPENTEAKVAAFVKKRGAKLKHTFAYADDRAAWDAWLKAAGREAIPCAFVVDRAGRIAYLGNPMFLGVVLPLVVSGNRTAQQVNAEVGKIVQEWKAVSAKMFPDNKAGLKALKEFEARYPPLANNNVITVRVKLSLLPKVGAIDEAKKVAEAVMARAIRQGNPWALGQVAALLCQGAGKESKQLLAVAVKAAEAAVLVAGDRDPLALLELASTYHLAGKTARARVYARMAIAAAAGELAARKQAIEEAAKRIADGK
jgi:hypothetical protein